VTRSRDSAADVHLDRLHGGTLSAHDAPPEPGRRQISGHDHLDAATSAKRTPDVVAARMTQVNGTNELMTQIHDA
jgi:hypothetical protein